MGNEYSISVLGDRNALELRQWWTLYDFVNTLNTTELQRVNFMVCELKKKKNPLGRTLYCIGL